jgi:hypothetical protein
MHGSPPDEFFINVTASKKKRNNVPLDFAFLSPGCCCAISGNAKAWFNDLGGYVYDSTGFCEIQHEPPALYRDHFTELE